MAVRKKLYSYIKHPFCKNGWPGFGLAVFSCVLTQLIVFTTVTRSGAVGLFSAALSLSAMLLDLCSFLFSLSSFREKEKNYTFAVIGVVIALIVLAEWGFIFAS